MRLTKAQWRESWQSTAVRQDWCRTEGTNEHCQFVNCRMRSGHLVDLVAGDNDGRPHTQGCDALPRQRLEGRMKSSKMNKENLGHLHKCGIPIASGLVQGRCRAVIDSVVFLHRRHVGIPGVVGWLLLRASATAVVTSWTMALTRMVVDCVDVWVGGAETGLSKVLGVTRTPPPALALSVMVCSLPPLFLTSVLHLWNT